MEVRAGYQLTQLGVIPAEWSVLPLKQISPSQSVGLVINPSTYIDSRGTVPMLLGSDVQPNKIDFENSRKITESSNRKIPASQLNAGDLVMVRVGEPGITAVIPQEFDGCNCASMMIVRKGANFDSNWLCQIMNSDLGLSQVHGVQYGTAQKQFNISDAVNFLYPTPPLVEQRAIATALSDVDALIAGLEKLIAKKRDLKQAAMQQLLTGQTRLPGFSGEWGVKRLGDLAEMGSGGTPPSANTAYYGGDIPWVAIADMTGGGKYIAATERNLTALGLANSAAQMFPAGTVLYAMYASLGECSISTVPVTTSQAILGIRPKANLNPEFLYYLLTSWKPMVKGLGQQGTQANLNKGIVADFKISLPAFEEQESIAAVLVEMDNELAALEARLAKTRELKQGMMQELLTGRTRLV